MKRFGNDRPSLIKTLERDIWKVVLDIVAGRYTALRGVQQLASLWESTKVLERMTPYERFFFKRGTSLLKVGRSKNTLIDVDAEKAVFWSPDMSIFTSLVTKPRPQGWDLPTAAEKHIFSSEDALPILPPEERDDEPNVSDAMETDPTNKSFPPAQQTSNSEFASLISEALLALPTNELSVATQSAGETLATEKEIQAINPALLMLDRPMDMITTEPTPPAELLPSSVSTTKMRFLKLAPKCMS